MDQLDQSARERFTHDLQRDKTKSFDGEFIRTTNLERAILDQYGRSGAEFILQQAGFDLSLDNTCPWHLEGLDAITAARQVLAPVSSMLPEFVSVLEERVRWIMPVRGKGGWLLAYIVDRALYDGRQYYELLFGGAPNPAPRLSARAESQGWILPRSLGALYRVHDGFGSNDGGILASSGLVDLGEMLDPIAAEQGVQPEGYVFQDLLEFRPDGAGNCQAFHRRRRDDADPPTVDWDHETWEISGETPFFEYADEELLRQISDEE